MRPDWKAALMEILDEDKCCQTCDWWLPAHNDRDNRYEVGICGAVEFDSDNVQWRNYDHDGCRFWEEA